MKPFPPTFMTDLRPVTFHFNYTPYKLYKGWLYRKVYKVDFVASNSTWVTIVRLYSITWKLVIIRKTNRTTGCARDFEGSFLVAFHATFFPSCWSELNDNKWGKPLLPFCFTGLALNLTGASAPMWLALQKPTWQNFRKRPHFGPDHEISRKLKTETVFCRL